MLKLRAVSDAYIYIIYVNLIESNLDVLLALGPLVSTTSSYSTLSLVPARLTQKLRCRSGSSF